MIGGPKIWLGLGVAALLVCSHGLVAWDQRKAGRAVERVLWLERDSLANAELQQVIDRANQARKNAEDLNTANQIELNGRIEELEAINRELRELPPQVVVRRVPVEGECPPSFDVSHARLYLNAANERYQNVSTTAPADPSDAGLRRRPGDPRSTGLDDFTGASLRNLSGGYRGLVAVGLSMPCQAQKLSCAY